MGAIKLAKKAHPGQTWLGTQIQERRRGSNFCFGRGLGLIESPRAQQEGAAVGKRSETFRASAHGLSINVADTENAKVNLGSALGPRIRIPRILTSLSKNSNNDQRKRLFSLDFFHSQTYIWSVVGATQNAEKSFGSVREENTNMPMKKKKKKEPKK